MPRQYDAIIVGSGACGGWAAMQLTQAGMRVLMLEAGSPVDPARDFHHTFLYQMDYRGQGKPGLSRKYSGSERNYRIMIDNSENPYTTSPETVYHWGRSRVAERFTGRAPVTAWPITNSMRPHAMAMAWTGR